MSTGTRAAEYACIPTRVNSDAMRVRGRGDKKPRRDPSDRSQFQRAAPKFLSDDESNLVPRLSTLPAPDDTVTYLFLARPRKSFFGIICQWADANHSSVLFFFSFPRPAPVSPQTSFARQPRPPSPRASRRQRAVLLAETTSKWMSCGPLEILHSVVCLDEKLSHVPDLLSDTRYTTLIRPPNVQTITDRSHSIRYA